MTLSAPDKYCMHDCNCMSNCIMLLLYFCEITPVVACVIDIASCASLCVIATAVNMCIIVIAACVIAIALCV